MEIHQTNVHHAMCCYHTDLCVIGKELIITQLFKTKNPYPEIKIVQMILLPYQNTINAVSSFCTIGNNTKLRYHL